MARKKGERYPSDEARVKSRPHVQVHLSARTHRIMGPVFAVPVDRGVVVGLWMAAFQAHATATGDIVTFTHADLCWLVGRERPPAALKELARVCSRAGYRVWIHPRNEPVPPWQDLRADLASTPCRPGTDPVRTWHGPGARSVPRSSGGSSGFGAVSVHVRNLLIKQIINPTARGGDPTHPRPSDTPNTDTPNTEEESRDKRATSRPTRSARSASPEEALRCAEVLIECLEPVAGARIPRGARTRWATEIARIPAEVPELRANGAEPWSHIEAAIRWALGPENLGQEYEVVIRSGRSLREKWPKLVAAAQRHQRKTQPLEEFDRWIASLT